MTTSSGRSGPGITPGIYQMYAERTAAVEAAFLLPHLRPGMAVLDVGCGLGSITAGLAEHVAPGRAVGIDLDEDSVAKARALAGEHGVPNVEFRAGSVYELPFPDDSFDAAFAHMVLMHLDDPAKALAEIRRVLRPGGGFGCAERAEQGDLRAGSNETMEHAWALAMRWQEARGSNLRFGLSLPRFFREAGFIDVHAQASYGRSGTPPIIHMFATFYNEPRIVDAIVEAGWANADDLERIRTSIAGFAASPDSMWALARCEAIGWKPQHPNERSDR